MDNSVPGANFRYLIKMDYGVEFSTNLKQKSEGALEDSITIKNHFFGFLF